VILQHKFIVKMCVGAIVPNGGKLRLIEYAQIPNRFVGNGFIRSVKRIYPFRQTELSAALYEQS
jgi:hypothetical protein